jgi:predicted enzyme related to lactoylglutathione lyase
MIIKRIVPNLPARDLSKARQFYGVVLGLQNCSWFASKTVRNIKSIYIENLGSDGRGRESQGLSHQQDIVRARIAFELIR